TRQQRFDRVAAQVHVSLRLNQQHPHTGKCNFGHLRARLVAETAPAGTRHQSINEHEPEIMARLFVLAPRIPQTDNQLHNRGRRSALGFGRSEFQPGPRPSTLGRYSSVLPFLITSGSPPAASPSMAVVAASSARRGASTPATI